MSPRPRLVVVALELAPYRAHFHRRIVAEVPEVDLWTLLTAPADRAVPPGALAAGTAAQEAQVVCLGPATAPAGRIARARAAWATAGRIVRWLAEHRAAALFAVGFTDWPLLRPQLWARRQRVPILRWSDANPWLDEPSGPAAALKRALRRRQIAMASAHLTCGELGREYLLRHHARAESVFLSPYEPDYALIERQTQDRVASVLRGFGLDPARRRILFCGRLVDLKRPDLALAAFAAAAIARPEWDLVLAGDGPLRAALEAQVPRELRARVRFLGHVADPAGLAALQRGCEVLLHPADREPWGVVIGEAAAAGMAIVATEVVGAAAEFVRERANGHLVRRGDAEALREALLSATSRERCAAMRAASQQVLAEWRAQADPIRGLRDALRFVGVLPG